MLNGPMLELIYVKIGSRYNDFLIILNTSLIIIIILMLLRYILNKIYIVLRLGLRISCLDWR